MYNNLASALSLSLTFSKGKKKPLSAFENGLYSESRVLACVFQAPDPISNCPLYLDSSLGNPFFKKIFSNFISL